MLVHICSRYIRWDSGEQKRAVVVKDEVEAEAKGVERVRIF